MKKHNVLPYDTVGLEDRVRQVTAALKPLKTEFDSIAVRGMSGVLVGAPVALRLHKPLVVVRKETEQRHSSALALNAENVGKRVLFLDDFVSGGSTRKAVQNVVEKFGGKLIAQYQYTHPWEGVELLVPGPYGLVTRDKLAGPSS